MDDPTLSKACTGCGTWRPLSQYGKDRTKSDGLTSRCRPCRSIDARRYTQTDAGRASQRERSKRFAERHPDRVAAAQRAWREKHPGYSAEANRKWREANPDAAARYYQENRERLNQLQRLWRERNRESIAARNREWDEQNRERRSAYSLRWQQNHPEKAREIRQRRRARMREATVGEVDVEALWLASRGLCGICLEAIDAALVYPDPLSASLDHIVPLAKGGTHEQANLQWAHLVCNNRKGAKAPDDSPRP